MSKVIVVQHPTSGERFATEIGPSDFYDGQDRILNVAGPMADGDDPRDWLANAESAASTADADWLGAELGKTVGLHEGEVYGEDLHGLLRTYGR